MYKFLLIGALVASVPSEVLSNPKEMENAAFIAASSLLRYYVRNPSGSVQESAASDSSGVQWYESGIMWETLMRNAKATGMSNHIPVITEALVSASFGTAGDFLGPPDRKEILYILFNQWNDDIGTCFRYTKH